MEKAVRFSSAASSPGSSIPRAVPSRPQAISQPAVVGVEQAGGHQATFRARLAGRAAELAISSTADQAAARDHTRRSSVTALYGRCEKTNEWLVRCNALSVDNLLTVYARYSTVYTILLKLYESQTSAELHVSESIFYCFL